MKRGSGYAGTKTRIYFNKYAYRLWHFHHTFIHSFNLEVKKIIFFKGAPRTSPFRAKNGRNIKILRFYFSVFHVLTSRNLII